MRATHDIEAVFGTRSRVAVLRVLRGVSIPLNASQIASRTGLTRPAVASVLEGLSAMGIVSRSSAGRANVHTLVRENVYVQELIEPAFRTEETIPELMVEDIGAAFRDDADAVVLFGSYARGDQSAGSDVDIVLVGRDAEAKAALERAAGDYALPFRRRFGATFSPLVYDRTEAASLGRRAPGLLESLLEESVIIAGLGPADWAENE